MRFYTFDRLNALKVSCEGYLRRVEKNWMASCSKLVCRINAPRDCWSRRTSARRRIWKELNKQPPPTQILRNQVCHRLVSSVKPILGRENAEEREEILDSSTGALKLQILTMHPEALLLRRRRTLNRSTRNSKPHHQYQQWCPLDTQQFRPTRTLLCRLNTCLLSGMVVFMPGLTLVSLLCMFYLPFQPYLRLPLRLVENFLTKRHRRNSHRPWRPRPISHRLALTRLCRRCIISKRLFILLGIRFPFPIQLLCTRIKWWIHHTACHSNRDRHHDSNIHKLPQLDMCILSGLPLLVVLLFCCGFLPLSFLIGFFFGCSVTFGELMFGRVLQDNVSWSLGPNFTFFPLVLVCLLPPKTLPNGPPFDFAFSLFGRKHTILQLMCFVNSWPVMICDACFWQQKKTIIRWSACPCSSFVIDFLCFCMFVLCFVCCCSGAVLCWCWLVCDKLVAEHSNSIKSARYSVLDSHFFFFFVFFKKHFSVVLMYFRAVSSPMRSLVVSDVHRSSRVCLSRYQSTVMGQKTCPTSSDTDWLSYTAVYVHISLLDVVRSWSICSICPPFWAAFGWQIRWFAVFVSMYVSHYCVLPPLVCFMPCLW